MKEFIKWTIWVITMPLCVVAMMALGIIFGVDLFFNIPFVVFVSLSMQGLISWIFFKRID